MRQPSNKSFKSVAAFKIPTNFDSNEIKAFARELNTLARATSHPNIVTLFGYSVRGKVPGLVVELANNDLHTFVKDQRSKAVEVYGFDIMANISSIRIHS